MDFGLRLKQLRQNKNLSQPQLAKIVGIHHTQICRYEHGESTPGTDIVKGLAKALDVSLDYLIEGKTKEDEEVYIYDRELLEQVKKVEQMEEQDRKIVKIFLDAFITKRQIQKLAQNPS